MVTGVFSSTLKKSRKTFFFFYLHFWLFNPKAGKCALLCDALDIMTRGFTRQVRILLFVFSSLTFLMSSYKLHWDAGERKREREKGSLVRNNYFTPLLLKFWLTWVVCECVFHCRVLPFGRTFYVYVTRNLSLNLFVGLILCYFSALC